MYVLLLTLHSWFRWAVLAGLLLALGRAGRGWLGQRPFRPLDNTLRHSAATLAQVQLMLGYALYFSSPLVASFRQSARLATSDARFFGLLHVLLMTLAVVVLTIGSALAKRRATDAARFRTMTLWFAAALLIMLAAIPWPFSPLANRPLFRF
ncbi:hypothetical protein [Hymenobacter sp. CRA2]|uniref:hypothetical protein n=1 Tax=Hymenobacter sp. CRA2 TaxID=1955620 RepID=UPI00098F3B5F|nr:hypothetical protein [Hymenobacter sp. CRA2]OON66994.1 hypothetical protein B0919_20670 [Hymenobacter sp. CRA2]